LVAHASLGTLGALFVSAALPLVALFLIARWQSNFLTDDTVPAEVHVVDDGDAADGPGRAPRRDRGRV